MQRWAATHGISRKGAVAFATWHLKMLNFGAGLKMYVLSFDTSLSAFLHPGRLSRAGVRMGAASSLSPWPYWGQRRCLPGALGSWTRGPAGTWCVGFVRESFVGFMVPEPA